MTITHPLAQAAEMPPAPKLHARRPRAGSPTDPDEILRSLPVGTRDYIRVVGAILAKHNGTHAIRSKRVSFKTMANRQRFLAMFFRDLRRTRFKNVDPRQLGNRHITLMVARWQQDGLSTGTIHNYLSYLRTFAGWIGKPGMVLAPVAYVGEESSQVHRCQIAQADASWTAKNVDILAKIAEVAQFDPWVGLQLELCREFGLRVKEARHFRPHDELLPRERADPRDAGSFPECEWFVRVSRGTKGGRRRDVPVQTDSQRALLERLGLAVQPGAFVGHPNLTSLQAQARFYYVVRKFDISRRGLGAILVT